MAVQLGQVQNEELIFLKICWVSYRGVCLFIAQFGLLKLFIKRYIEYSLYYFFRPLWSCSNERNWAAFYCM